jgi:cystathionine beta-synthase
MAMYDPSALLVFWNLGCIQSVSEFYIREDSKFIWTQLNTYTYAGIEENPGSARPRESVQDIVAVYESVLDAIGETPLIRLRRVTDGIVTPVYVKAEFFNPGGSVKDRAALGMVRAAELSGDLRPGGTIVEGTSGNTGIGLAIIAAQLGYRLVVVVPDKSSDEKLAILKAYGAEVVVTDGSLPREHPKHVSQLARQRAEEIPGAWFANQYDNLANPEAHRRTTGPEIWRQTEGRITHLVAGIGTGGTISGAGDYLKRVSTGAVTVIGADPEQSTYSGGDGSPYYVESIGHFVHPDTVDDLWPQSYDPAVIDRIERVSDEESFAVAARLAREEGLLAGTSSGTALAVALRVARGLTVSDVVVALLPDSGRSYLSKNYADSWLQHWGFAEAAGPAVRSAWRGDPAIPPLVLTARTPLTVAAQQLAAIEGLGANELIPVIVDRKGSSAWPAAGDVVGVLTVREIRRMLESGASGTAGASARPPLPIIGSGERLPTALDRIAGRPGAIVVSRGRVVGTVTAAELAAAASIPD